MLSDLVDIKCSDTYNGNGIFSKIYLSTGTVLHHDSSTGYYLGQMNDADFKYPVDYSYETLYCAFAHYKAQDKHTLCNIQVIDDTKNQKKTLKVLRNIFRGQELTKRYGIQKWSYFIYLDIVGENPVDKTKTKSCNWRQELHNLKSALQVLGYVVTYPKRHQ